MEDKQALPSEERIIINDLLSFMLCKCKDVPKEKLLHCVRNFYSHESILEAQRTLFSIIPLKKSIRPGKSLKHLDPLVSMYEYFLHKSLDNLPVIVCKDLNNVPSTHSIMNKSNFGHNINSESFPSKYSDNDTLEIEIGSKVIVKSENNDIFYESDICASDEEDSNWQKPICKLGLSDKSIYKKEQFQMRCQISEMVAIISELKEGLKNFTNNLEDSPSHKPKSSGQISDRSVTTPDNHTITIEANDSETVKRLLHVPKTKLYESYDYNEGYSNNRLAMLQKFIDEDDEENIDLLEDFDESENLSGIETNSDEYDVNLDIFEKEEDELGLCNTIFKHSDNIKCENFSDNENESFELNLDIFAKEDIIKNTKVKKNKRATNIFKHPLVVVPSKADKKVILIQEEDKGHEPTVISNCNFSLEADNSMDMSSSSDSIKQLECFTGVSGDNIISSTIMATEENEFYSKNQLGLIYLQCPFCDGRFNTDNELRRHKSNEHMSKCSFNCILCSRNFTSSFELHAHFVNCLSEAKQTKNLEDKICSECGTFFAYPKALKTHMIYHSEGRKFLCSHCSLRFNKAEALDFHIKNKHSPLNTHLCLFCPQKFISQKFLTFHMRNHTGEKPFQCEVCAFKSSTSAGLRGHLQTHGSSKKVVCKICNFTCYGFSKLTRHMQFAHTTPLVCPRAECGKSYIHYFQYKRHRASHLEEAKFKCSLCLYSTSIKSSEVKHIRTHSTANYQCPECFVNLASKHNVSRHLKSYCRKNFPLMEH